MKCKECREYNLCLHEANVHDQIFNPEYDGALCFEPLTNADHIRAMSDDELAELFDGIVDNGNSCILICGNFDNCKRNNSIERICKNHYLEWLKQPYKE